MKNFLLKTRDKIKNFDIFALGNSAALYYILIYGVMPLVLFLHLPSKYVEYFLGQNIQLIDSRIALYLLIGILSFILGYRYFYSKKISEKAGKIFNKQWNSQNIPWVFAAVFISGLIIKLIRIFGGGYFHLNVNPSFAGSPFYSLIGFLDWLGPVALSIAFIYYFYLFKINDSRYKTWQIIAWLTFGLEFIYGFFTGSRFVAIVPIIVYLIVKHYLYQPSFYRVSIAFLLVFFILMPLQNFYKNPEIFLRSYITPINHQIEIKPINITQYVVDNSVGRVSQSWILINVFENTEKFLYGKSLTSFLISLGPPRFIWKDKPLSINASGNEFGRQFGVLSPDDFKTSAAPTMVGDWYMNFGILGIIFGMFLIGGMFRLIFESFIKESNYSLSGVMIYSIILIEVIKGMEDFIAPVWAGLVKIFVILLIIHFCLIFDWKKFMNRSDNLFKPF